MRSNSVSFDVIIFVLLHAPPQVAYPWGGGGEREQLFCILFLLVEEMTIALFITIVYAFLFIVMVVYAFRCIVVAVYALLFIVYTVYPFLFILFCLLFVLFIPFG